ncbi:c-type cytochrome [Caenispirillum bisanense]|uniref:Cytochrome c domain-containing protein n=1 Tax=Caenispirillum bisanense TaxID=414052 RepID=A0A286GZE0_9PROT|nr:cytochrome c [Caenispirillum bisanense]SOE00469.1 hypothetical protein SAMN05421508_112110 [Caenispirillum bisanense]
MRAIRFVLAAVAAAIVLSGSGAPAAAEDLHRLFEDRCAACHGDAGPFAHEVLAGRGLTAERLARFLGRHGGAGADAGPLATMLLAQAETPPLFRRQCTICHGKAADFVRDHLIRRDGILVGRYTARPVAPFLDRHAGLTPAEQAFFTDLLTRVEGEVHAP